MRTNTHPPQTKRDQFRLQIRRKQIQTIFAQRRKIYSNEVGQQIEGHYSDPAISNLIRKSLTKNCLVPQLPYLLPNLANKLKNSPSIPNIQFVISVSSNILRDHIQLQQKQYIYIYCMKALEAINPRNISPLVEVYFYETVMAACYFCFDEPQQFQIEQKIMPRLIQLLCCREVNMKRVPTGYQQRQCHLQIVQQVLSSLVYYYQSESNHNTVLLYKVKRTIDKIIKLIDWAKQQLNELKQYNNFFKILEFLNTIFNNISGISFSLYSLIGEQKMQVLVDILIGQFYLQSQDLEPVKILSAQTLITLLQDQQTQILSGFTEGAIKIMIKQLECCINTQYLINIIRLFNQIINTCSNAQIKSTSQLDYLLDSLLSTLVNLLGTRSQETQIKLFIEGLKLIRSVLSKGFDQGNSEYVNYLSNIGAQSLLDNIYAGTKDKDMLEILEGIYMFFDIC